MKRETLNKGWEIVHLIQQYEYAQENIQTSKDAHELINHLQRIDSGKFEEFVVAVRKGLLDHFKKKLDDLNKELNDLKDE